MVGEGITSHLPRVQPKFALVVRSCDAMEVSSDNPEPLDCVRK